MKSISIPIQNAENKPIRGKVLLSNRPKRKIVNDSKTENIKSSLDRKAFSTINCSL
jgi:hypothetical protein